MTIKLVAIDIDGTLLNDSREVTSEVLQAIQEAKRQGVKIVLTTGRPLPGVHALLQQLNLEEPGDYVITYNGGLVQDASTGEELARYGISYDDYLEIDLMARKMKVHMHAITNEHIYTANRDLSPYTIHESFLVSMPVRYRTQEEMTEDMGIVKTMFIDEPDYLDKVIADIPDWFKEKYTTVKSAPFYYEVLNKKASKGAALIALADKLGIAISETMAIGDEENDLSMLEVAGLAVAMGNSKNANILEAADVVTASNNEHGVAKALYDYVLK